MKKKANNKIKAKKAILELFKSKKNQLVTLDEIYSFVIKKAGVDKSSIEQQLKTLVELKTLYKTSSKKYCVANSNLKTGIISIKRRDICVITDEKEYQVKNSENVINLYFSGDEVLFMENRHFADIVSVKKRAFSKTVGRIEFMANFAFLVLDNNVGRDVIIEFEHLNGAQDGDLAVAEIYYFPKKERERIKGRVTKILGKCGSLTAEKEAIINKQDIKRFFDKELLNIADNTDETISKTNRVDLTLQRCFTIDPLTAKDFDDSIFVEKTNNGFNLFVHIADVSHYILKDSVIDKEAFDRGNSVYTPGEVIPMLPEKLSNDLCSLKPNIDRYAFTCEMKLSKKGEILSWKFYHSVINSKKRFTYEEAQKICDNLNACDTSCESDFREEIETLYIFAKLVEQNNIERGYINFNLPESDIKLKQDGSIETIGVKHEIFANKMVEVCMLLANECAAKEIENSEFDSIFRVHDKPDEEKLNNLLESFALFGIDIEFPEDITPKDINNILEEFKDNSNAFLVNEQLLRSMQKAVYSSDNIGHFGLALENYAHFTSPIRRYADLMVHRTINAIINKENFEYDKRNLTEIANHISDTEKKATTIERKIEKLFFVEYMKDKIGEKFNAKISGVISAGVFVQLENSTIEGMIPAKFMSSYIGDFFTFDSQKNSFFSRHCGELYLGKEVTVRLKKVDPTKTIIDFELLEIL